MTTRRATATRAAVICVLFSASLGHYWRAAAQQRTSSPFSAVTETPMPDEPVVLAIEPEKVSRPPSVGSAILGSLAGSALGMIAATAIGPRAADASSEPYVTDLDIVLAGSIVGSTLGAGLVTGNMGWAFLGSLSGTVASLAIVASGGALVLPVIQAAFAGVAAAR